VLPRQICCGPFTNLTENFLISLYFLNRPAGRLRMRLTVLTLTAGSVLPKIYGSLNSPACSRADEKLTLFVELEAAIRLEASRPAPQVVNNP